MDLNAALAARKKRLDTQIQNNKPSHQSKILNPIVLDEQGKRTKRFIVMSDTHLFHSHINLTPLLKSDADNVLLHCGDFTDSGTTGEVRQFVEYLQSIQHHFKSMVVICGNHETLFALKTKQERKECFEDAIPNIHYLEDDSLELDGIKIYGSPWVPNMSQQKGEAHMKLSDNCFFFADDTTLQEKFKQIPNDTQILLTHSPPDGILDNKFGCKMLKQRINELGKLKVHCFGHIHMKYGVERITLEGQQKECTFINAAMDEDEQPFYFDVQY